MQRSTLVIVIVTAVAGSVAYADDSNDPPEPIWVSAVTATSTFKDSKNAYAPVLTLVPKTSGGTDKQPDVQYNSAWCEGKPDEGIGEAVTIAFAVPTEIKTVTIKAGVWKTQKLFDANNIITGLELVTDDGRKVAVAPPAERKEIAAKLGGGPIQSLTVRITAVKKGRMNDSCLTEIALDGPVAVGFDATAAKAYAPAVREIATALFAKCDATVLAKVAQFPLTFVAITNTQAHDPDKRFLRQPRTYRSAAAFAKACPMPEQASALGNADVASAGAGKVSVGLMMADYTQTLELAWKKVQWRLVKID